ncbi:MAG: hypothetical protein GY737_00710 [Desulfobacteraceae bacterium]|nr:hypothetical protein [Desulfobacteraceae bacterium]
MTPITASLNAHITGFRPAPSLQNDPSQTTADPQDPAAAIEGEAEAKPLEETATKGDPAQTVGLTENDLKLVRQLKTIDTEVRNHEMAHIAAGGQYVTSGATFQYRRGPDGVNYAVAGEVSIDTSPVPGDPGATIEKMRRIKAAALAPASPSAQDRKVAANAATAEAQASSELMILKTAERTGSMNQMAAKDAAAAYAGMAEAEETEEQGNLLDIAA